MKHYDHEINIERQEGHLVEMLTWCNKNLANEDWLWNEKSFCFTCQKDATLFALRWAA